MSVPDRLSGVLRLVYVCTVDLCHFGVENHLSPGNVGTCSSGDWEILLGHSVKDESCIPQFQADYDIREEVTD